MWDGDEYGGYELGVWLVVGRDEGFVRGVGEGLCGWWVVGRVCGGCSWWVDVVCVGLIGEIVVCCVFVVFVWVVIVFFGDIFDVDGG